MVRAGFLFRLSLLWLLFVAVGVGPPAPESGALPDNSDRITYHSGHVHDTGDEAHHSGDAQDAMPAKGGVGHYHLPAALDHVQDAWTIPINPAGLQSYGNAAWLRAEDAMPPPHANPSLEKPPRPALKA